MPISMVITANELLAGACFPNEQARLNAYVQATSVVFPLTATAVNYGSTTPSVDNQDLPWYKLEPDGTPSYPDWYSFQNGNWVARHALNPGDPWNWIYRGSEASIETLDGGSAGTVGDASGPMWEIDTTMSGLFPLGVSGSHLIGTTGGAETHTLTSLEVPATPINGVGAALVSGAGPGPNNTIAAPSSPGATLNATVAGGGQAHSILNPFRAVYFLKRTNRLFYVG